MPSSLSEGSATAAARATHVLPSACGGRARLIASRNDPPLLAAVRPAARLARPDASPMAEADLAAVAGLLPDDLEQDPAATTFAIGDERISRGIVSCQHYWKAYGLWHPGAWRLNFVVSAAGHIIGVQELEGNDFPVLRTVDTSSFLVPPARGRGYGSRCAARCSRWPSGPCKHGRRSPRCGTTTTLR